MATGVPLPAGTRHPALTFSQSCGRPTPYPGWGGLRLYERPPPTRSAGFAARGPGLPTGAPQVTTSLCLAHVGSRAVLVSRSEP